MNFYLIITLVGTACCLVMFALVQRINRRAPQHYLTPAGLTPAGISRAAFPLSSEGTVTRLGCDTRGDVSGIQPGLTHRAIMGSVEALCRVVRIRDLYTANHQHRVADLAQAIAREMGLGEDQQQGIHVAALLHDIGKIGVPTDILSKPGQLSESEFDIVKTHSRLSAEVLASIDFPWPVVQAVSQHHERLDGTGYPLGSRGTEIVLEARIIAVADVVEAMSSHRPYRPALRLDQALDEITRYCGTRYDAAAVSACLKLCRREGHLDRVLETIRS
jgi:putative nucleotidyltransferase with HDIG domain